MNNDMSYADTTTKIVRTTRWHGDRQFNFVISNHLNLYEMSRYIMVNTELSTFRK